MLPKKHINDPKSGKPIPVIADAIVIGGGIAGLSFAKKQAEQGKTAAIFEQRKGFMLGASGINPGRMGLGFHYADLPTAFTYLKATIDFVKKYKKEGHDFRLGSDKYSEDHLMRRGRYFVPQDSLVAPEKLLDVYHAIRQEYKRLVDEDPENKVFGEPDTFYRILLPKEYKNDIASEQEIAVAVETREQLLDVPEFRKYLISQVEDSKNIEPHLNANVTHIEKTPDGEYYIITVEEGGEIKRFAAPNLINASWESADKLNKTLGILMEPPGYDLLLISEQANTTISEEALTKLSKQYASAPIVIKNAFGEFRIFGNTNGAKWTTTPLSKEAFDHIRFHEKTDAHKDFPENTDKVNFFKRGAVPVYVREEIARTKSHIPSAFRTNRIKIIAEVELPESLKDKPCMFFAIGPFCMFSNMQNGRGLMTYAPETNYVQSKELFLTADEEEKLHKGFDEEETQRIGKKIIDGVAKFIPEMKNAKLIGIRPGNVKTYGDVDLCDPNSDFHKRRELGIQELEIDGALEISSMKLLYGEENAEQAVKLLNTFETVKQRIAVLAEQLAGYYMNYPSTPKISGKNKASLDNTEKLQNSGTSPVVFSYLDNLSKFLSEAADLEHSVIVQKINEVLENLELAHKAKTSKKNISQDEHMTDASYTSSGSSSYGSSSCGSSSGVEDQDPVARKIIANHFYTFIKRNSSTKDFTDEQTQNALMSKTKQAIKLKSAVTSELKIVTTELINENNKPSQLKFN